MTLNQEDPAKYPIIRGSSFDNPWLDKDYLREVCRMYTGRRYAEEILGEVFSETEGALFQQAWINDARVTHAPPQEITVVSLDPGISVKEGVDGSGIVVVGRAPGDGGYYVLRDHSAVLTPEQYATIVCDEADKGASAVIVETNRGGDTIVSVIRVIADRRGIEVRLLKKDQEIPKRSPGILYVREIHSRGDKASRGDGPAALYSHGQVHHVGTLPELESEQCTFEPGLGMASPNRYDALNQALSELASLTKDRKPSQAKKSERLKTELGFHAELRSRLNHISSSRRLF
jgi:phage terminase large subunit-like protein